MTFRHPEWQQGQETKTVLAAAYLRLECGRFPSKPSANPSILVDSHPPGP